MLYEDNLWAMRKDVDSLLDDGPCLRWVNQVGWKESLRRSSPEDACTGGGQFGDLLIERGPYAVQPGCRLMRLSVCEPSWNLPARTPAVLSLPVGKARNENMSCAGLLVAWPHSWNLLLLNHRESRGLAFSPS